MPKERLDVTLVKNGLADSREKAQRFIRAGQVLVDDQVVDVPSTKVVSSCIIRLRIKEKPFISRGGLKLDAALEHFGVEVSGRTALDVGASTGGFTDCLLKRGAALIYAVDVGYNQLDYRLRTDERVVVHERTNARYLTPDTFSEPITLAVMDVSFISITLVLPAIKSILVPGGELISLVKPQFEAGRSEVGKGGIIKAVSVHKKVLERVAEFCDAESWFIKGITDSPLLGAKGNREFFIHLKDEPSPQNNLKKTKEQISLLFPSDD